ncbi:TAM domain methyltransferase [Stipitochalara longipes BDJ]|nr:TAM domain methyltransferase [Stipitochalara longipes BDJ]
MASKSTETPAVSEPAAPATAVEPAPIDDDHAPIVAVDSSAGDGDSAYNSDEVSRYTDSLSSSVRAYKFENGRRYHAYHSAGTDAYLFPNDDSEQDRLDMFHHTLVMGCDGKLFLAPINPEGMRILDIGCGTGIWAIQMADEYPSAEQITGNDLSPIQPGWVPPNVRFLVDDVEEPWPDPQPYDFINCRYMGGSIKDWPGLLQRIFDHLKPGGWVELSEYDINLKSQDNTIPKDYKPQEMLDWLVIVCEKVGRPLGVGPKLKGWVEQTGFTNVGHGIIPLPIGIWPRDKKLKTMGAFMSLNYTEGVDAFTKLPYTGVLGWTVEEVDVFNAKVRTHVKDKTIHAMHEYHFVWAQKPKTTAKK